MNARRVRLLIVCLSAILALVSKLSAQSAGYLSGRMIMTPWNYPQPDFQPVNLSDPEILDWTFWGLSSNTSVDRRSGAGIIGSLSVIGPDVPTQDQNCFDEFTWNNGDQNPSVPIACAGLMVFNTGEGFQFTVPADRTPKTLKLYVGIEGATARLETHLKATRRPPHTSTHRW